LQQSLALPILFTTLFDFIALSEEHITSASIMIMHYCLTVNEIKDLSNDKKHYSTEL